MSRNLIRRGGSVLVAAALLGGGMALGVGTASAAEAAEGAGSVAPQGFVGSVAEGAASSVLTAGMAGGSIDSGYFAPQQCLLVGNSCWGYPTNVEALMAWMGLEPVWAPGGEPKFLPLPLEIMGSAGSGDGQPTPISRGLDTPSPIEG